MAEAAEPIPSVFDLPWFSDLTLYQHPPCTFILWYLTMGGLKAFELITAFLGGGGGEGGEGGSGGGSGGEKADAKPAEDPNAPAEAPADPAAAPAEEPAADA